MTNSKSLATAIDALTGSTIMVYGPSGVGKTQLAASFPGPVAFLATEEGTRFLPAEIRERVVDLTSPTPMSWRQISVNKGGSGAKLIKQLVDDGVKTIVVDTILPLYYSAKLHHGVGEEKDNRSNWDDLYRDFMTTWRYWSKQCAEHGITMVWLCHAKTVEVETRHRTYDMVMPELTPHWNE